MAKKRSKEQEARMDGMIFAMIFMQKDGSIKGLEHEIEMRKKTGMTINERHISMELNQRAVPLVMNYTKQAHEHLWCYVLMKLGFGAKRIKRNLESAKEYYPHDMYSAFEIKDKSVDALKKIVKENRYYAEDDDIKESHELKEYRRNRDDGIDYALRVLKEKGTRALFSMITRKGYNVKMSNEECDVCDKVLRGAMNECYIAGWLIGLNHNEGYGNTRLNRVMDLFEKYYGLIGKNRLGFEDMEIELAKIGIILENDWLINEEGYASRRIDIPQIGDERLVEAIKEKLIPIKAYLENIIEEPSDFMTCPCFYCNSKVNCKRKGYKHQCDALGLYKLKRREDLESKGWVKLA